MIKVDTIDKAIIDLLEKNGRISNREVGRTLNISEGTVRQRLKKLTEQKAMRLGLVTDMEAVGLTASIVARIKTQPSQTGRIAKELAAIECCKFVGITLGRYDIVAFFIAQTRKELANKLDVLIAAIPGITGVDLHEPVASAKHRYELVVVSKEKA